MGREGKFEAGSKCCRQEHGKAGKLELEKLFGSRRNKTAIGSQRGKAQAMDPKLHADRPDR